VSEDRSGSLVYIRFDPVYYDETRGNNLHSDYCWTLKTTGMLGLTPRAELGGVLCMAFLKEHLCDGTVYSPP